MWFSLYQSEPLCCSHNDSLQALIHSSVVIFIIWFVLILRTPLQWHIVFFHWGSFESWICRPCFSGCRFFELLFSLIKSAGHVFAEGRWDCDFVFLLKSCSKLLRPFQGVGALPDLQTPWEATAVDRQISVRILINPPITQQSHTWITLFEQRLGGGRDMKPAEILALWFN